MDEKDVVCIGHMVECIVEAMDRHTDELAQVACALSEIAKAIRESKDV